MSKHHMNLMETLNMHADQPTGGVIDEAEYSQMPPEQRQDLLSLLNLAERTREALAPVVPSPDYRQRLAHDLTRMAERRTSEAVPVRLGSSGREWLLGAAIGSAVAVLGGAAYLIGTYGRARSQRASQAQT